MATMEEIVAIITRAVQNPSGWNPFSDKGNVLVFSSEGRVFLLPTYAATKGITISTLVPIAGSLHHIKKLKEEDRMVENTSISQCEQKAERIIKKDEIAEFKIEKHWGIKGLLIVLKTGERLLFGTVDQEGLKNTVKEFPKYLSLSS